MKTKRRLDCIVAGDANVDLMMEGVSDLRFDQEQLAFRMDLLLGGSSAISAFNLASLGSNVGFVGVIGSDLFGDFVAQRFRSVKIDLAHLKRSLTEKTGITIWHSSGERRAGVTYAGTIAMLRASDIADEYLKTARHLHIGHYFLLKRLHAGAAGLLKRAKTLGLTTSLDCNYDPAEKWDSGLLKVLKYTDIFFPNESEALNITGCSTAEAAAERLGKGSATVVVKLGERGAFVHGADERFHVAAKKVRVVDTTGAGDSFNAGFLNEYLRGANLRCCAASGISAATRSVTRVGGTAAFEGGR